MIILPELDAVYVAIPRTGSKSMSMWLEQAFRADGNHANLRSIEALHDWHANLSETREVAEYPLFRMWSFAVVRNPFDRLVSWAAMVDPDFGLNRTHTLRALLGAEQTRWMLPQVHFTDGVKHVYRYEELPAAVADLRQRLGISEDIQFPTEHETNHDHYRAYFDDDELRLMVQERYASDFSTFGYRF